mmetsp:Transcript_157/g.430  ORF Transcript_157/g.430 Transcript_157/m.430 type:complete len:347 (-) Transcript_157:72-1112(-)
MKRIGWRVASLVPNASAAPVAEMSRRAPLRRAKKSKSRMRPRRSRLLRKEIQCELARVKSVLTHGIQQWPGGESVPWEYVDGTCAVVSNSGVLKSHTHGAAIDAASRIFRFNDAPLGEVHKPFNKFNYTAMVGRREDVRVVNDAFPLKYLLGERPEPEREARAYLVMPIGWPPVLPESLKPLSELTAAAVYSLSPEAVVAAEAAMRRIFDSDWWSELGQERDKELGAPQLGSPSSGLLAALLAAASCKESRNYGFPATLHGASSKYHYYDSLENWENPTANSLNQHLDSKAEKYLFRLLAANSDLDDSDVAVVEHLRDETAECKKTKGQAPALPVSVDHWDPELAE